MDERRCGVTDCPNRYYCRGYCDKHYQAFRAHGTPTPRRPGPEERFWTYVQKSDGCWQWTGGKLKTGYGCFGGRYRAHRYAYELLVGPIPPGMLLDHVCHNRLCVNPKHLRLATNKQNMENLAGLLVSNTTGFRGVCLNRRVNRYMAYVNSDGKRHYLGYYKTAQEAGEVARLKRLELFTHNELDRTA